MPINDQYDRLRSLIQRAGCKIDNAYGNDGFDCDDRDLYKFKVIKSNGKLLKRISYELIEDMDSNQDKIVNYIKSSSKKILTSKGEID